MVPPRRTARPGIAGLIHAALIAYPRYMDPVSGLPCPVEVALDRLAEPGAVLDAALALAALVVALRARQL